jgi:hypothetical protein
MEKRPARQKSANLSSEGDEWENYLEELASKQGRILETGFAAIDEPSGGLSLGLMLLVDEDVDRRVSLLKQLIDQAPRDRVPPLCRLRPPGRCGPTRVCRGSRQDIEKGVSEGLAGMGKVETTDARPRPAGFRGRSGERYRGGFD